MASMAASERRECRSGDSETALQYQLQHTLQQGGMAALVLADDQGMLLAWAGEAELCQELGAVAPLVARGAPPSLPSANATLDISVRALMCFGQSLYLASLGGGMTRDALLSHSARGVERILTAN